MLALAAAALILSGAPQLNPYTRETTPGSLDIVNREGKIVGLCPLKQTDVKADITGFGARVTVSQTFTNPSRDAIEAIYTFPLPSDAAVDRMTMKIGDRIIAGVIRKRDEARRIYEAAKNAGQAAALLDQERPNVFTQSVANITPGSQVKIEISYVQLVKFEDGMFDFNFPMVVGPRFVDSRTPDPDKVTPPTAPKGVRVGTNVSMEVNLDAGMPIETIESTLHEVRMTPNGPNKMKVELVRKDEIPNRDFILKYRVAGDKMRSALLTYADPQNGGFFTLILMPPKEPREQDIAPKEVIYVMDQSGSQSGFPIEKSKELTLKLIDTLGPNDTFNVLSFSNSVSLLWPESKPNTDGNRMAAKAYVNGLQANGGTNLIEAVNGSLAPPADPKRRRMVVFNTDGYVGNEFGVLEAVQKNRRNTRMFTFGIGNSVNRFLIDGMSAEGRGDSEIVTLASDADEAAERFVKRTRFPLLVDVSAEFKGVQPIDLLPTYIPDVFSEKPIVLYGRYTKAGKGTVTIRGKLGQSDWSQTLNLTFPNLPGGTFSLDAPETEPTPQDGPLRQGSAVATLWARQMIDDVQRRDWIAAHKDAKNVESKNTIIRLGLAFGLMTQHTSFVAVEQRVVNVGGKQRRVNVPVDMADGVDVPGMRDEGGDPRGGRLLRGSGGGLASGGFGGGGAAGLPAASPAARANAGTPSKSIEHASYDPSDNSIIVRKIDELTDDEIRQTSRGLDAKAEAEYVAKLTPKQRERYFLVTRVDPALLKGTSKTVELVIRLADVDAATLAELKRAGLTVDSTDKGLKVAFGSSPRAALGKIAAVKGVLSVKPL